jgi:hypothetical protein
MQNGPVPATIGNVATELERPELLLESHPAASNAVAAIAATPATHILRLRLNIKTHSSERGQIPAPLGLFQAQKGGHEILILPTG